MHGTLPARVHPQVAKLLLIEGAPKEFANHYAPAEPITPDHLPPFNVYLMFTDANGVEWIGLSLGTNEAGQWKATACGLTRIVTAWKFPTWGQFEHEYRRLPADLKNRRDMTLLEKVRELDRRIGWDDSEIRAEDMERLAAAIVDEQEAA